ncbi:hypothetical protein DFP91_4165 [Pseudorhodoplanes sinuspersici]|nr:hypothetical protein DFP91_4165 [Pseudorhodoplanes sinuspersici]
MGIVISLTDIRNGRMRNTLLSYALEGESAMVETRASLIAAEKILCRDTFAEMFNSAGDYFAVDYSDIRDVRPARWSAQTSAVNASGDWLAVPERLNHSGSATLLHFPRRSR